MRKCEKCGELPDDAFNVRASGYCPNFCRACERGQAKERRRARYADPAARVVILNQNSVWRSCNADALSEKFRERYNADASFRRVVLDRNKASRDPMTSIIRAASASGVDVSSLAGKSLATLCSEIRAGGYLPPAEPIGAVFDRLSKSRLSEPLPQSYAGVNYLDNTFPHRYRSSANGMKSVHDAFHDDRELVRAVEYVAKSGRVPTRDVVLRNVKFNVGMPSHFLPESAAALVSAYAPGGDVLDPFLGWGGRTLGAACAGARSVSGTDLQALSVDGCRRVMSDLSGLSECAGDFHEGGFSEFMGSTNERFDLVLTSPPFIDTEDYGSGRHGTTQAWIQSVVIPLARGCGRVLRPGGRAAVHVQERPKVPVMTSVLSCFSGAGWDVEAEHVYGRKGGQKVLVFRRTP